jgi:hypothetical protein
MSPIILTEDQTRMLGQGPVPVFGVLHIIFGAVFIGLGVFMHLIQLRLLQAQAR